MNQKLSLFSWAVFACLFITSVPASAQGTAFTYQGQLSEGGVPAKGLYDVCATLFTCSSGGSPCAGPVTNCAVPVNSGHFVATLDFGNVFDGAVYWMELAVRQSGAGPFVILSPRQQLTPTPYAVFANTASNLDGALSLAQLPAGVVTNNSTGVTLSGSFTGDAGGLTNLFGQHLGDYGMNNMQSFWGRMNQQGRIKLLSLGDSTGRDVVAGLMSDFNSAIGVNGVGISATFPTPPWLNISLQNVGLAASINGTDFTTTNWWGGHYGLSNTAAIIFNRWSTLNIGSAYPVNSNVVADTACVMWVQRTNGGNAIIEVSTNGGAFTTIGSIASGLNSLTPRLGFTNILLCKTNYTLRITGQGGGDGYCEVIGGGLYATNGPGAFIWNLSASGHDWCDYLSASTNVLWQLLTNVQPDIIIIQSVHSPVPQYVIDSLSNCSPAQIVIMASPPSVMNGPDYTYKLSYTNRQTAINNATNKFNPVAFCDTWSWMSNTNWNNTLGFYADGVHCSEMGQRYEGDIFLRSIGVGGGAFGLNTPTAVAGSANGFNSENYVPVGIGTPNLNGQVGHFDLYTRTSQGTSGHTIFDGMYDMPGNWMGMSWWSGSVNPALGPFSVSTNAVLIWADNLVALVPPKGGQTYFGRPSGLSWNPVPERGRIESSGSWWMGNFDTYRYYNTDLGEGVLSIHNGLVINEGTVPRTLSLGNEIWMTNGLILITNTSTATARGGLTITNNEAAGDFVNLTRSNVIAGGVMGGYSLVTSNYANIGGHLHATNGISSFQGNKAALMSSNVTTSPYLFTNAFDYDIVVYLYQGTNTGLGINGTFIGAMTNILFQCELQPGEWLCDTNSGGVPRLTFKAQ